MRLTVLDTLLLVTASVFIPGAAVFADSVRAQGPAVFSTYTLSDPTGDADPGLDITSITQTVYTDRTLSFDVSVANTNSITSNSCFDFLLDINNPNSSPNTANPADVLIWFKDLQFKGLYRNDVANQKWVGVRTLSSSEGSLSNGAFHVRFNLNEVRQITGLPLGPRIAVAAGSYFCTDSSDAPYRDVTGIYGIPIPASLAVSLAGGGRGQVVSSVGNISCSTGSTTNCQTALALTTAVTLTATPAAGSVFSGWSGSACAGSTSPTCSLTVSEDLALTATFTGSSPPTPTTTTPTVSTPTIPTPTIPTPTIPTPAPTAPAYDFVGGTLVFRGSSKPSTLFAVHFRIARPPRSLKFRIRGPLGWNNNKPFECWIYSANRRMPKTDFCEPGAEPISGTYIATPVGSKLPTVSTDIDAQSVARASLSLRGSISPKRKVTFHWKGGLGGPYWLFFFPLDGGGGSGWGVVPRSWSSAVFRKPVNPWKRYSGCITALPEGTADGVLKSPWNAVRTCTEFGTKILGWITANVSATAAASGGSIRLSALSVSKLPARTTVELRCIKGCSVREKIIGSGTVRSRRFVDLELAIGSIIEVRATKPGFVGFYDRLVAHPDAERSQVFAETELCLPPVGGRPEPEPCRNFK